VEVTHCVVTEQGGRELTHEDLKHIQKTVRWLPGLNRKELAATLCEHLDWYSASGSPKVQACLKLLEKLDAQGWLRLPEKRPGKGGQQRALAVTERTRRGEPLVGRLGDVEPISLEAVTEAEDIHLWNEYVARYHPLGYKQAFGNRLRYFIRSRSQPLGCLFMGGAAKAIAGRDRWIGWSDRARLRNLPWVINNTRFLIFPWVHIPHLASHVLGHLARRVVADWQRQWGFSPLLMETFVDPRHFAGTCYRAAGWVELGQTSGRGLVRPGKTYHTAAKLIFVKPLHRHCRRLLCTATLQGRAVQ
jgi:hypothetical protein